MTLSYLKYSTDILLCHTSWHFIWPQKIPKNETKLASSWTGIIRPGGEKVLLLLCPVIPEKSIIWLQRMITFWTFFFFASTEKHRRFILRAESVLIWIMHMSRWRENLVAQEISHLRDLSIIGWPQNRGRFPSSVVVMGNCGQEPLASEINEGCPLTYVKSAVNQDTLRAVF